MGVVLLDSVVVIAYLDRSNVFHAAAYRAIAAASREGAVIASAVNYAEVMTGARLGHAALEVVRGFFRDLVSDVVSVDIAVADRAAELRAARPSLRLPDALVLATADGRADQVLTADQAWCEVKTLNCEVQLLA